MSKSNSIRRRLSLRQAVREAVAAASTRADAAALEELRLELLELDARVARAVWLAMLAPGGAVVVHALGGC